MKKKITKEEFIRRAREVHGDKYDYSKVQYERGDRLVRIICPVHGEFLQTPTRHTYHRCGCPICGVEKRKKPIYGVGINDAEHESQTTAFQIWEDMIRRCYCSDYHVKFPTYKGCTISDEWRYFSKFKQWFDKHYVAGWQLDKDILVKGNKEYSSDKCCFVPNDVNTVIIKPFLRKSICRGVSFDKKNNKYMARMSMYGRSKNLGRYNTVEEAFEVYRRAKELYIKELAEKWKDKLDPRVYAALYNYRIEIYD